MNALVKALVGTLVFLAALIALPAAASALVGVTVTAGEVMIEGDESPDHLTATVSEVAITIESTTGLVVTSDCTPLDETRVDCELRPSVVALLGGGADKFVPGGSPSLPVQYVVLGGGDGDDITGGPEIDELRGDEGDDTLRAAGGGADQVKCGPGTDTAYTDPTDEVEASCEIVNPAPQPPVNPDPPGPPADDAACGAARERLAKAKAKLKKLRKNDAAKPKIKRAKRKVKKAKEAVAAACLA
jgi:hypothetical protein